LNETFAVIERACKPDGTPELVQLIRPRTVIADVDCQLTPEHDSGRAAPFVLKLGLALT
jgi:hypothetical protein